MIEALYLPTVLLILAVLSGIVACGGVYWLMNQ